MNFKKVFCLLLSVMMIITAFSASAVSAGAETSMPGTAFGGDRHARYSFRRQSAPREA